MLELFVQLVCDTANSYCCYLRNKISFFLVSLEYHLIFIRVMA